MHLFYRHLLLALATPLTAHADTSMLRVVCEGNDAGAAVFVNGKFKGKCPLDTQVNPGTLKLRVVQNGGALYEQVFEQDIRMDEGAARQVEVRLGPTQLNAVDQQQDAARLNAEARNKQEKNRSRTGAEQHRQDNH